MENCTFCGYKITPGTGKMYVKKDARILWFCSRRCEKNMLKLGRSPRAVRYTAEGQKAKQQQMAAVAHEKAHGATQDTEKVPATKPKPSVKKAKKAE
jgi:large subunit ribosomal protein L24e